MRQRLLLATLALASLGVLAAVGSRWLPGEAPEAPAEPPPAPIVAKPVTVEREGVSVAFDLTLNPRQREATRGAPLQGTARFALTDAKTGAPLQGRRTLGWMSLRGPGDGPMDDAACKARVKTYLGGLLSARAEVDLNSYWFLTLNHDQSISVINPQIAFDRTKLHSLVSVGGSAEDWVLTKDRTSLYVTVSSGNSVSVVDLERFLATRTIPVGKQPGRIALAPDGRTAWVSNDADGTVSVLDTTSHSELEALEVGAGRHEVAFADEGRTAWLTSTEADVLTAVDVTSRDVLGTVKVGAGAGDIAWSAVARAVFLAQPKTNEVLVVDPQRREVTQRISVKDGLGALRFDRTGRWAFLLHPKSGTVDILDAARGQVAHTLTGFSEPDTVVFTDAFAYVRNTTSGRVSLVELRTLEGAGTPSVVQVTMGQRPPAEGRIPGRSDPIAALPEGNGVIVAGAADRALYLYQEGMMAPRGTHLNYGREPRAVLVLDRSLREVEPGVYTAGTTVRENGVYDVQFLLDNPRAIICAEWKVGGVPEDASLSKKRPLTLTPEFDPKVILTAGVSTPLRFKLEVTPGFDAPPVQPEEVRVLLFKTPGTWQSRTEPRALGQGLFEVDFTPPSPGQYKFVLGVESRNIDLGRLPHFTLGVAEAATPTAISAPEVRR
ncbi:YncE family protein [Myxococcus sp. K15C18031901]|uniref:YncE family protein n=1 Tax=Myxococcus dinghuensis TaxID=2906761 RepID=UPI0020A71837|nr:YncE family protein [Myxococcus dinghuensis]MCP3100502.1 YncE family protein [Myxococcus dinghuensis]